MMLAREAVAGPLQLLVRYCLSDVGSQSEVAEPPALLKSRQKLCFSNLSGKLSFSRTVATGSSLSLLVKDMVSSMLLRVLFVIVVESRPPVSRPSEVYSRVSHEDPIADDSSLV